MAAGSLRIIVLFGQEYVDKPRLVPFKPVHVAAGVSSSDDAAAAPPYYSLDYETRKKKDDDLFLKTL